MSDDRSEELAVEGSEAPSVLLPFVPSQWGLLICLSSPPVSLSEALALLDDGLRMGELAATAVDPARD